MATRTKKPAEKAEPTIEAEAKTEAKTFWLNDEQVEKLVKGAKSKGLSLDEAIEKLAKSNYLVGDRSVYITGFVAKWHNLETDKSVKNFF